MTKALVTGATRAPGRAIATSLAKQGWEVHALGRDRIALDEMRGRGLKLACVTNKPERFTRPLLEGLDLLRRMDCVVGGDTLTAKKPDPLPLAHCAEEFGIEPRLLLMVGDSAIDCAAARAAGCPVFCVPYGYPGTATVQSLDCDAIVPAVSDCLDFIQPVRS